MTNEKGAGETTDATARLDRRDLLSALGALGPLMLLGCGSTASGASGSASDAAGGGATGEDAASGADGGATAAGDGATSEDSAAVSSDASSCNEIPDETAGPYPDIDGMISNTAYERADITEGLKGIPLTLTLQVLNVASGCVPIAGARVIIWHCDANGVYSEYASSMNSDPAQNDVGATTTTYLRGWQETDSKGTVTFTTIFPGWYTPRVTHIHVMVYNPNDLTTPVKTTQFTFSDALIETVYDQTSQYPKGQNSTTVATDMVFAGSDEYLVAAVTGSVTSGYAANLPVGLTTY